MHIPDGFLDAKTVVVTGCLAAAGVGLALREATASLAPSRKPLMGLAAAFVFAAQMVNFPIPGGTSGHLIGSTLCAILLGPAASVVVMAAVLIVQCFLFSDGGVLALGANLLNLAVVATMVGHGSFRLSRPVMAGQRGLIFAATIAAWCSTVAASIVCAGELAWSGLVPWPTAITAMANVHFVIGIGEGLITALVLATIARVRPELLSAPADATVSSWRAGSLGLGLLAILGLALFVAPFACPWPDGLDHVADTLGFAHRASESLFPSPATGYRVVGITSPLLATAIAGGLGTLVTFGLAAFLARRLLPRDARPGSPTSHH